MSCPCRAETSGSDPRFPGAVDTPMGALAPRSFDILHFPVMVTPDKNGTVIAEVPDIPGTVTFGQDEAEALDMALDAAVTMLSAMMDDDEDIPSPSDLTPGQPVIELPPMAVVKLVDTPRRGRPDSRKSTSARTRFNPRPRAGGDRPTSFCRSRFSLLQSTPPRRGRHDRGAALPREAGVSIHAPAQGATSAVNQVAALARFQSTPPRRGRLGPGMGLVVGKQLQSTPPRRGRPAAAPMVRRMRRLQSTPRAGGDAISTWTTGPATSFNPRPRAGGDFRHADGSQVTDAASIHAPAQGATSRPGC